MKKRKTFVTIALSVLLTVIILFSLASCVEEETFVSKIKRWDDLIVSRGGNDELYYSDVKFADLEEEYQTKLADFCEVSVGEWGSESVFRNMINGIYSLALQRYEVDEELLRYVRDKDWKLIENCGSIMIFDYRINVNDSYSYRRFSYVEGREDVCADEVVISRWAYHYFYALQNKIRVDEAKIKEIIDSDNVYAKYVFFRNLIPWYNPTFIEGLALAYYGLVPDVPTQVLELEFKNKGLEIIEKRKVVGWYDDGILQAIGGHNISSLGVVCGFDVSAVTHATSYPVSDVAAFSDNDFMAVKNKYGFTNGGVYGR